MRELAGTLAAWRADGARVARAVVVRTFGSAPRPEGAVMLVADDGRLAGSVSGGCVEGAVFEAIERARADGRARVVRYGISDERAWDVGLACGGTIDVLVEPAVRRETIAAAAGPGGVAVVIPLPADSPPPEIGPHEPGDGEPPAPALVVHGDGRLEGSLGDAADERALVDEVGRRLDPARSGIVELAGRSLFVEVYPVPPRLVVVGAVEVAMPLVTLARELGFRTLVIDARAAFATRERFPDADELVVGWPDEMAEAIRLAAPDSVAVLTHDPKIDEPAIVEALRRGCRYVGAIGSQRTQAARRGRLRAAGVGEADLARLHGPIGLDLGGRSPAETALSIMAEIVAVRHGAAGGSLRDRPVPVASA